MRKKLRLEPYWIIVIVLVAAGAALFAYHLGTGQTPNRAAITIEAFNFDIFWYGILIVSGIALGSFVVYRLAKERAELTFADTVTQNIRRVPIGSLGLNADLENKLRKRSLKTLGALLYEWGLNSQILGLKDEENEAVYDALLAQDGVEDSWLQDAPWRQWNPDYVFSGVVWVLVLAVIGARLYHVLTPSPSMAEVGINSALDYFKNPLQLINIRSGGLGIYGAVLGGLLGIIVFTKRQKISAFAWADLAVVGLALGQAIGRWGNFFNQELYGAPSDLPWAIKIDPSYRLSGFTQYETFHPAFLYASLWNFLMFVILVRLARKRQDQLLVGDLTAIYFLLFAIGRILLELVRLDSRSMSIGGVDLGVPVATVVSIFIALTALAILIWRHLAMNRSPKD